MKLNSIEIDEFPSSQGLLYQNLDGVLSRIGQFGSYQKMIVFTVSLVSFSCAFNNLGYVFWAARLDHHCIDHHHPVDENISYVEREMYLNRSTPWEYSHNAGLKRSQCYIYEWDNSTQTFMNGIENNKTINESCQKWSYDHSVFKSSVVSEMNLVCSRKWLVSATQSVYMVGRMVGSIIYGHASDRFGRRPSLMAAILLQLLFSNLSCWFQNIYAFLIVRFLLGIQTTGEFQIAFVIVTENVGPAYRTLSGIIVHLFWAVGYMLVAGIAYLIRERFWLQVALSVPLSFLVILYWLIPETPRFLLGSGQRDECIRQLKKMATRNNVEFPKEIEDNLRVEDKIENCSLVDLFKYKNLRCTTLILMTAWFACGFVYYGLSLNSASLSGDPFMNFFLSGFVEIPAYLLVLPLFSKFGRPVPLSICFVTLGIFMIINIILPNDTSMIAMTILGKGCISSAYVMVYIFTAELYPTKMRSIGVGTSSILSRIGATLAPFSTDLGYIWRYLPFVTFCGVSFAAGLLVLMLPETKGRPLPQTIEEGETFNATHRFSMKCLKKSTKRNTNK